MFKKLLKYDMLSVWRLWWICAITTPVAALVGAFSFRYLQTLDFLDTAIYAKVTAAVAFFVSFLAIILSYVLTMVLIYFRFYKNFYTDEGYLTFTLPVTRKELLLSKTVSAFIWTSLQTALTVMALFIFLLIGPIPESGDSFFNLEPIRTIFEFFSDMWQDFGAWTIVICFELVVLGVLGILQNIAIFQLSITMGAIIAKKAKIIASLGMYYLVSSAISFVGNIGYAMFGGVFVTGLDTIMYAPIDNEGYAILALVLVVALAFTGIVSMILYNLTQYLLDRKLNLA